MKCLTKVLFTTLLFQVPSALAQQVINGRFYPEKEQYLVGEPIIVDFEVVNGSDKVAEIDEDNCPWRSPRQFEVDGAAPKKEAGLFTWCGVPIIASSCLEGVREIPSSEKYVKRLLLDGPFELDSPGRYHIRAKREQEIRSKATGKVLASLKVESEFDLTLQIPKQGELEAAYQPLLNDLHSEDAMVRYLAASAVTQNPPPFTEAQLSHWLTTQYYRLQVLRAWRGWQPQPLGQSCFRCRQRALPNIFGSQQFTRSVRLETRTTVRRC
jgi:hypothetical protein